MVEKNRLPKKPRQIRSYNAKWIVALGLIMVLFAVYGSFLFSQETNYKEYQLMFELQAYRNAVIAFQYMNGRTPKTLNELASATFIDFRGNKKNYLPHKITKQNCYIDPFGNPYIYNAKEGWVTSSSQSYVAW